MAPRKKKPDVHSLIAKLHAQDTARDTKPTAPAPGARPLPRFLQEAQAKRAAAEPAHEPVPSMPTRKPRRPATEPVTPKPGRKPRRPDGPATDEDKRLAANLAELVKQRGISGRELSRRADLSLDTVRNIISGRSTSPRARTLQALADQLGVSLSALYGGEPPPDYVAVQLAKTVTVQELAPSPALASGDVTGEWTLPAEAVGSRLPENLRLFTAPPGPLPGELRPGDRLLADLGHTEPSPPGLYVLSDGTRSFIAHVRRSTDPRGTLTVEHGGRTEEVPEKSVSVLGRVVARWTAL